jgi:hypothetical protein
MAFLSSEASKELENALPGTQLIEYWRQVAQAMSEGSRTFLSFAVVGLVSRGWLNPLDKVIEAAIEDLGEKPDVVAKSVEELKSVGALVVDGQRIVLLAGIFFTSKTRMSYFMGDEQKVYLLGPLAGLAVSRALGRPGDVQTACFGSDEKTKLRLSCDENGVHSRSPESVCMFLRDWTGESHPADAIGEGGFFADDDALCAWQENHDEPEGMPLPSMMFSMATTELGDQLGSALETMLDRVANFS